MERPKTNCWAAADAVGGVLVLYDTQRRELYVGRWTQPAKDAAWVDQGRPLGEFLRSLGVTLADCATAFTEEGRKYALAPFFDALQITPEDCAEAFRMIEEKDRV